MMLNPMSRRVSRRQFLTGGLSLATGGALWLKQGNHADAGTLNVQDFGAVGDGQQDDTSAIRQALAALPGTLIFPAGDYRLTGELKPRSGSNLVFDQGARLVQYGDAHILHLTGVSNVKISGALLHHTGNTYPGGPSVFLVEGGSHDLEFQDVTIERGDGWAFYLRGDCHHILIDGYTNLNKEYQSSNIDDGMDIAAAHDVVVRNFDIRTNDDAISVKSFGAGTYNILIEDGVIRSRDAGLTFGGGINSNGIRSVLVRNVQFDDVGVPVYFKGYLTNDTGEVREIAIQNITATGRPERFIFFHTVNERVDKFHDITIEGANLSGPVDFASVYIQRQRDITLRNVNWQANGSGAEGLYLLDTHDSRFESLTFQNYGGSKPVKISGSGSVANEFIEIPPTSMSTVNGASIEAQLFSAGPVRPISEVSSIRWP